MKLTGGETTARYEIIVLAGGGARRLGGRDKPGLVVAGGRTLIGSVVAAGAGAARIIVVGPRRAGLDGVLFVREEPAGAGPVPALRRGLAEVAGLLVAILAADLPFLRAAQVGLVVRAAVENGRGAVLADDAGHPQWLAGCWQTAALRAALAGYAGDSLRGLLGPLEPALVRPGRALGEPPPWLDCDTPADLDRARNWA
jgi:molybdopterin-guanine dinucleotide biosynthesis protein A